MLNALTIDLEDWYHGLIPPAVASLATDRVWRGLRVLLDLMDEAGAHGTFFILGEVAKAHPEIVAELARQGHEIGIHGYHHVPVYSLTHREFSEDIRRAKSLVEDLAGAPVRMYRAPFFSVTQRSLWALGILREQGILCDSSIFPVHNWRYGIPGAPRAAHLRETTWGPILEVPVSTVRVGINLPVGGGFYLRALPQASLEHAFRILEQQQIPGVVYIHPWELDVWHPRIRVPLKIGASHYWNLGSTKRKLRYLLSRFQFTTVGEVFGHLLNDMARTQTAS